MPASSSLQEGESRLDRKHTRRPTYRQCRAPPGERHLTENITAGNYRRPSTRHLRQESPVTAGHVSSGLKGKGPLRFDDGERSASHHHARCTDSCRRLFGGNTYFWIGYVEKPVVRGVERFTEDTYISVLTYDSLSHLLNAFCTAHEQEQPHVGASPEPGGCRWTRPGSMSC